MAIGPGWSRAINHRTTSNSGKTGTPLETLREIGQKLTVVPEGFNIHRTIRRFLDARRAAIETELGIDWATAEALAFGGFAAGGSKFYTSAPQALRQRG